MSIEAHSLYYVSLNICLSFPKVTASIIKIQLQAVFSSRKVNDCIHILYTFLFIYFYCQGVAVYIGYTLFFYLHLCLFQSPCAVCIYLCTAVVVPYVIHAQGLMATLSKCFSVKVPFLFFPCPFKADTL